MATSRPDIICGHFLTNSSEVLVTRNDSFRSILNFEAVLGTGIVQGAGHTKMDKLHHPVPEKSQV